MGDLAQIKFGSVHKVKVKRMTKLGAVCELENGIKAIVTQEHIHEKRKFIVEFWSVYVVMKWNKFHSL